MYILLIRTLISHSGESILSQHNLFAHLPSPLSVRKLVTYLIPAAA